MPGYSSNQTSGVEARDHGWHNTSSKQHSSYGTSASQWSSRGSAASATVSGRSDWSGRGSTAATAGGSSFASSAKNVIGSGAVSASSRAAHNAHYDAYKPMANAAARRY